ncbi:MAG: hypothetical protein OQK75_02515 [Gammaproteobacteria bacterium]|nr:hypothetical protein [Gammaproteobacteria bacterium]MCW8986520.1 hypothetical protein [Gammaproteobacteria bacterium]MCW9032064.1 hypothetical protein [Gammaproteobacteria bacterium]
MKIIVKRIMIISFAMLTAVACSTTEKYIDINNIPVEKVSSMDGKIIRAELYRSQTQSLVVRGELKRQFFVRGAQIPGYLRVELFNAKGEVFKEITHRYGQKNSKLSKLSFAIPITVDSALISKVRVVHHNSR